MFWNKYPYTNFHELNLDWIIARMLELNKEWDEFTAVNKITNAGAWDITKQYQAWTVVSDNNAGYISLKPVPAGVAISNTEYWGLIADYDILITDLSNRIAALETTVGDASSGLVKKVNDLEIEVASLADKKIIFISDSYGYHPSAATSWISKAASYLGLDPAEYNTWYEGSTGFIHQGVDGHTFLTLAQGKAGEIFFPEKVTDVVLCAGTNDAYYAADYTENDIKVAINDFCTYINTTYPNAKIHLGMCGNFIGKDDTQKDMLYALPILYGNGAVEHGGCYIQGIQNVMHAYNLFDDAQHPNLSGAEYIARIVAAHLAGGSYDFVAEDGANCSGSNGNTVGTNTKFSYRIENDFVTIKLTPGAYNLASPGMSLLNYELMKLNPRKFGCPDTRKVTIDGFLVNSFTTMIPVSFTFEVTDPDSLTGCTVYISTNTSAINISSGGMNFLCITIPTMLF